ncbi:heterotrimeric G protein alpha subunit A [Phycomyces nitens]|nr:heterotrimeric G protein alpha subunit A [Phycomyces nitens]
MGSCLSTNNSDSADERKRQREINRELEKERIKQNTQTKILLLGSGESGKSTILKQMKIINQNGYTTQELFGWRVIVFRNIIESAQALVQATREFGCLFTDNRTMEDMKRIERYAFPGIAQPSLDRAFVKSVARLWNNSVTMAMIEEKGNEFYLMDSAPYFFEALDRIGQPGYIPTEQDVLRARHRSTGITEICFQMENLTIRMLDVGGQRSERRKWIHCFEAVTSVIFCVAMSEYDQVLLEETKQNRMLESLALFESIINSRWFLTSSIVLFLNKQDLFESKIQKAPLSICFPDYEGGNDPKKAAKYILWRFLQTNRARLTIYPHLTQATDTTNIRFVFAAVKETIVQNALRDSGMV